MFVVNFVVNKADREVVAAVDRHREWMEGSGELRRRLHADAG